MLPLAVALVGILSQSRCASYTPAHRTLTSEKNVRLITLLVLLTNISGLAGRLFVSFPLEEL